MSSVVISGDTSGSITLSAPAVAGTNTITLPALTGNVVLDTATQTLTNKTLTSPTINTPTMGGTVITAGTTNGLSNQTSITYSSIPSWVKRITVIFNGVKTNGTSYRQVQLGSGSTTTSGYTTSTAVWTTNASNLSPTTGFYLGSASGGSDTFYGHMVLTLLSPSANTWTASYWTTFASGQQWVGTGMTGAVSLSGTLDRVVLTTVNGTDQYNAGQVNIFYE